MWVRLNTIYTTINGYAFKKIDFLDKGEIPIIKIANITKDGINFNSCKYTNDKTLTQFKVLKGDIIIALSGATTGKMSFYNSNTMAYINQRTMILRQIRDCFNTYLLFNFVYTKTSEILQNAYGGAQPNISSQEIENMLIPLPPVNEQEKIYMKLLNSNKIILDLKKYIFSNIASKIIIKNKILNSIFCPNSSYKSYYGNRISTNLEEYIDINNIGDGDWVLSENMDEKGNIKLIQLKHIGSGKYIDKPYCKINNSFFTQNKCSEIKKDYLLINRLISDKMNVCIMPDIQSKCITSVDVCWIKPNNKYLTKYLMYYLMSPCIQKEVLNLCSGSTRKRISKKNLIKIPMLIHNLNVQKEIVKEIDKIFSLIDSM